MTEHETKLTAWGSGEHPSNASRQGQTVLKKPGPWSPSVLALLDHFERVGLEGAPRRVGNGYAPDGRMTVSYVPGVSAHPGAWPDDTCPAIGALLRRVHDAGESFEPPAGASWASSWLRDLGSGDDLVLGHGDAAPWNIVRSASGPALIDWDSAGPIDRLTEVAYAVWLNAQLHDDDIAALHDLPPAADRARQARAIVDGYELSRPQRESLVERMIEVALAGVRADAVEHTITPDSTAAVTSTGYPVLWSVTWRARSAGWMLRHRQLLTRTIQS